MHPSIYLNSGKREVPLISVGQVNEPGHVQMGQAGAAGAEPGHSDVRDVFQARHAEVGQQGTSLAEAVDPRVRHLLL